MNFALASSKDFSASSNSSCQTHGDNINVESSENASIRNNNNNNIDYSQFKNSEILINISCKLWLIVNAIVIPKKPILFVNSLISNDDSKNLSNCKNSCSKNILFSYDMLMQIIHRLNQVSSISANILHCKKILKLLFNHGYIRTIDQDMKSSSTHNLCLEFDQEITKICNQILNNETINANEDKIWPQNLEILKDSLQAKIVQNIAFHLILENLNICVYRHILDSFTLLNQAYKTNNISIFSNKIIQKKSTDFDQNYNKNILDGKMMENLKQKFFSKYFTPSNKSPNINKIADNFLRLKNLYQYILALQNDKISSCLGQRELYASLNFVIYELFPNSSQIIFPCKVAELLANLAILQLKGESHDLLISLLQMIFLQIDPSIFTILNQIVVLCEKSFNFYNLKTTEKILKDSDLDIKYHLMINNSLIQQLCFGTEMFSIAFAEHFCKLAKNNSYHDIIMPSNNIASQQLLMLNAFIGKNLANILKIPQNIINLKDKFLFSLIEISSTESLTNSMHESPLFQNNCKSNFEHKYLNNIEEISYEKVSSFMKMNSTKNNICISFENVTDMKLYELCKELLLKASDDSKKFKKMSKLIKVNYPSLFSKIINDKQFNQYKS